MPFGDEVAVAAAFAVGRGWRVADRRPPDRVQGLAWMPAVGAGIGLLAAVAAMAIGAIAPAPVAALAAVVVLRLAGGGTAGVPTEVAAGLVEWLALLTLAPTAGSVALVTAPMLARWASVVQCYGGRALPEATGLAALAGRARFREFAIASVTALGTTLVVLDAVGLAVAVACALVTLGVRLVAYRRRGGIDDGAMNATSALVETSALVLLAFVGSLLARR
jgi:cobalamin synthase